MTITGKILGGGILTILLLSVFSADARGQGITRPFGGYIKVPTLIMGKVVCTDCTLDQAQKANPGMFGLHLFKHADEQAVFQVNLIHDASEEQRWEAIVFPPRVSVRTANALWQKLTAKENLWQEIQLNALLRSTQTLDIFDVHVAG